MTIRPMVAVSQRVEFYPDRDERRDSLDQRLCMWLRSGGFLPIPVPNCMSAASVDIANGAQRNLHAWLYAIRPSAVVLSGGNDIGEYPDRDITERSLLAWAEEIGVPVLGICRGMQMMSVQATGMLKPIQGHVRTRHHLCGDIVGEVNSFHKFTLTGCPPGFEVLARAEDNEIEAIRHVDLPWEGWMWHPEREQDFSLRDLGRVRKLFGA